MKQYWNRITTWVSCDAKQPLLNWGRGGEQTAWEHNHIDGEGTYVYAVTGRALLRNSVALLHMC